MPAIAASAINVCLVMFIKSVFSMPERRAFDKLAPHGVQVQDENRAQLVTVFRISPTLTAALVSREPDAEPFRFALRNCFVFAALACQSEYPNHATCEHSERI